MDFIRNTTRCLRTDRKRYDKKSGKTETTRLICTLSIQQHERHHHQTKPKLVSNSSSCSFACPSVQVVQARRVCRTRPCASTDWFCRKVMGLHACVSLKDSLFKIYIESIVGAILSFWGTVHNEDNCGKMCANGAMWYLF